MLDGVLKQVRDEADQQPSVAGRDSGRQVHVESDVRGVGPVRAQRVPDHDRQVDGLSVGDPLLPLGEREERVDQLLLLLVLLERVAAGLAERLGCGARVGDDHLEQRARGGQRRAKLMRRVGHEPSLRVVGSLERAEHPSGHQPPEGSGEDRHDGQRDGRLDLQLV